VFHLVKIGPLGVGRQTTFAYVALGGEFLDIALEPNDVRGIAALTKRIGNANVMCEPALAVVAATRGFAVGELPEDLVAMKAAFAVLLDHGTMLESVGPELLMELIAATVDFEAAQPWHLFEPDEPIEIRYDGTGREVEACVMGQGGEQFGLALYREKGSIARLYELAGSQPDAARKLESTALLIEEDSSCAIEPVRALTGMALAPIVMQVKRGKPTPMAEPELAMLIAAVRAVTELTLGARHASGTCDDGRGRHLRAHAKRTCGPIAREAEPSFEKVGRNEPCPCGSGKKFKRCCLLTAPMSATAPRASVHEHDERVMAEVLAYGRRRFGVDSLEQCLDGMFGGQRPGAQLALPLLAYECPIEGVRLAARFANEQAKIISASDRRWIDRQVATHLSVWEVLRVEAGRGLEALDLLTGERRFIHEVSGSRTLVRRDAMLARVLVADDTAILCGVHESPLAPREADRVITKLRETKAQPGDWPSTLRMIALWTDALQERERKAATPMTVTNTDGHPVTMIEDHFALAKGAFAAVFAKLAELDGALIDEHDRKGARLTFTRPGNAMHASWQNTVIGSARLTATKLVMCANSVERGDALRARVESTLGPLASWRKRSERELPQMFGGETVSMDAQATDLHSTDAAYRSWLDAPLPDLGGRTPRQAAQDDDGRARLHLLLKDMENRFARKPDAGPDPTQFRRELGLDDVGAPLADLDLDRALGSGRKISETLLDFVRPLVEAAGAQQDEHRLRAVLSFGTNVWNLVVSEQLRGSNDALSMTRIDIKPGTVPADILVWFDRLVTRKRAHFAGDRRFVGNWRVHRTARMVNVEMEARLDGPLAERAIAAGIVDGAATRRPGIE
jgi:hypothetical protein